MDRATSAPIPASGIDSQLEADLAATRRPSRNLEVGRDDLHASFTRADLRLVNLESHARTRLIVAIRRRRLDRDLAEGGDRHRSDAHELRATKLTSRSVRSELARSLRAIVFDADNPPAAVLGPAVTPLRREVRTFRRGLLGIAESLEWPASVSACGVARVRDLLADGASPLYNPNADRSLIEALWWIDDGLKQCHAHEWSSPVIMKVDPEHVAWTCSRCGAIATTSDPASRPA